MPEFQQKCTILTNDQLTDDIFRLVLQAPKIATAARPGQFIMVRPTEGYDPLLRRPFSIHRCCSPEGSLSLLFKSIGKGTEILAQAQPGSLLDIMGPLGQGFTCSSQDPVCLIGGG
ncbi:MAG: dihydroorotate dehydrogenase electron transfer subunit, partial [Candidatus Electrothrix sp. AR3]|nr:dihydroorotate dehydrogenase electron transfer subunit [Candidatus Electrothrix sp. AR3]